MGKLSDASLDPTSVLPIFNNNGDLSNGADVAGSIKQLKEDASKASNGIAKKEMLEKVNFLAAAQAGLSTTDVYEQVSFFYLYDLIDVILDGIGTLLAEYYPKAIGRLSFNEREDPGGAILRQEKEMLFRMRENFKKLRVLLGPLEIRDPSNPSSRMNISIGEIPISNKYFIEWMTSKMLAQERTGMTLTRFMNLFIKNYLRNFLNDTGCNGNKTQQPVSLYNASISSYSRSAARDELTTALIAQGQYPGVSRGVDITGGIDYFSLNTVAAARNAGIPVSPVLNTMGSRIISGPASKGQKLAKNYMIFYAGRTRPDDMMVGNHGDDTAAGIFHYMIGKDRGLVKNIQLVKTSATGHKEVRFEQEGYDGLLQLREVYNVTVDSFLMPNAFPGTYIFVDPRGFAPDTRGYQYVDPTNPDKKL